MKPIKLVINNFGPYKGYNEVDFTLFNSNLFVISGPTGSGKTFLFDAICYALYSKTSTDKRSEDSLKCIYSSKEDIAYVEFTFEINNNIYFIHKEPRQIVAKKRGSGEKEVQPSGVLKINDKLISDRVSKINERLEEIIGLKYDDFKMTVMVAQGQFYELINANTEKRKEIFRKILKTKYIDDFINLLKEKYLLIKNENIAKENEIITLLRGVETLSISLNEYLKEKDISYEFKKREIDKEIDLLDIEINKSKKEKNELLDKINKKKNDLIIFDNKNKAKIDLINKTSQLDELNKQKEDILKKTQLVNNYDLSINIISLYQSIEKKSLDINNKNNLLNNKKVELDSKNKDKEIINNNYISSLEIFNKEIPLIEKEIIELNKEKESFSLYLKSIKEIDRLNKDISNKNTLIEKNSTLEKNKINELDKLNKSLTNIDYLKLKEEEENKLKNEEIKKEKLKSIERNISDYKKENNDLKILENELIEATKLAKESSKQLLKIKDDYYSYTLSTLSSFIKEDEPCPLCGSLSHPNIYHKEDNKEVDKQNVIDIENKYKEDEKHQNELSTKYDVKKENVLSILKLIKNQLSSEEDNVEEVYLKIKEDNINNINIIKNIIEQIKNDLLKQNKIKEDINNLSNEILSIQNQNKSLINEINIDKEKINLLNQEKSLSNKYLNKDLSYFDNKINEFNNKRNEINNNLNNYKDLLNKIINEINIINNEIKMLEQNIIDINKEKDELNQKYLSLLNEGKYSSLEEIKSKMITKEKKDEYENEIKSYESNLLLIKNKIEEYKKDKIDEYEIIDLNKLEEEISSLNIEFNKVDNIYNKYYSMNINNKKIINNIKHIYSQIEDKIKEEENYRKLYQTSTGDISKTNKINFEVYYQSLIFEEILLIASNKFLKMSNGRYKMMKSNSFSKKIQSGLDIDVLDYYSGEKRSASSLSGGETFQASLSLALSLVETIQAKAGGIELNSMFIDEGFGTLDKDNLEMTKKTLLEVSSSSLRTIGIISHVEDIEKDIPNKLIIVKTINGSYIKQIKG